MQVDDELAEIMNKYKPGSAVSHGHASLTQSDQVMGFESVSDEEEEKEDDDQQPTASFEEKENPNRVVGGEAANPPSTPTTPTISSPHVATPILPSIETVLGVVATTPPPTEPKLITDRDALSFINARFEALWKLETDHSKLKEDHASLEQAKQQVERERNDWQNKSNEKDQKIAELTKGLEEERAKYNALEKKLKELEDNNTKLNAKLGAEKERYTLLSGQFEELNSKLVEIVTNVTHMKTDDLPGVRDRSPRKSTEEPSAPSRTPTKAAAGFTGFFTVKPPPSSSTPGKK